MATLLSSLITRTRGLINAPAATDIFWTDPELLGYMNGAINDLYRRFKNNGLDEFFIEDSNNVSAASGVRELVGLPTNIAEIRGIRPRALASNPIIRFWPRKWNDYDFQAAEASQPIDPTSGGDVMYVPVGTSGPVFAPGVLPLPDVPSMQILIAPRISGNVPLTLAYVPSRTEITDPATVNPIPGEADMALVYWTAAHALMRTPHGGQLSMTPNSELMQLFELEAGKVIVGQTPRQSDEPDVAEAFFEMWWP